MGQVIPLRPSQRRRATTDTASSTLVNMYRSHVTSSIRTDLESVTPERRRHAMWELTGLPPGTRVTLHVGAIDWPEPEWLRLLAHAIVEDGIHLELETAPDLRGRWHHGVLRAIAAHPASAGARA